jgi:pimeloyl-ACP methyl ester carboxylesterase
LELNEERILMVTALLVLLAIGTGLAVFTWITARYALSVVRAQGSPINAGGVTFNVHQQGQGQPVILIHGLTGQMRQFTYGVATLLAPHFHVITIDRPGSGHSVRPTGMSADISAQATAIADLIGKLRLGPAVIAGHSLGGAIALTLAVEHPHCVSALALLAPLTHLPKNYAVPLRFRVFAIGSSWLRTLLAWTIATPGSLLCRPVVLGQAFGPEPVPPDYSARGGGLMSVCPHHLIAASLDLQAIPERLPAVCARYHELRIPVQVLFGRQDRILSWKKNGQALVDKVPQATLTLVDGGHMLPVTQVALCADFIRSVATS